MKVAINNPFGTQPFAETELSIRMKIALNNIGHEADIFSHSDEINEYGPDFVLALHPNEGKTSAHPTYGCMWSPPIFYRTALEIHRNISTYDGYFYGSEQVQDWVCEINRMHPKSRSLGLILPSANYSDFSENIAVKDGRAKTVYLGSNWDAERHRSFFTSVDGTGQVEVYGRPAGWKFLRMSYRGSLPFDGASVGNAIKAAGIALCLHTKEHAAAHLPTMRIFETTMAGAVAISDRHPFVEHVFGDSVLYVDNSSPEALLSTFSDAVAWIKANPVAAIERTRAAHAAVAQYSLERQLSAAAAAVADNLQPSPASARAFTNDGVIQVIVRTGDRPPSYLRRALQSLRTQRYKKVQPIVVCYDQLPIISAVIGEYPDLNPILVSSSRSGFRSTQLFDGLRTVSSEYFSILDDDDIVFPNHFSSLVPLLNAPDVGLAYSGSIRNIERGPPDRYTLKSSTLAYFRDVDIDSLYRFDNYITSNSFVAKAACLSDIYVVDPKLMAVEDLYLVLMISKRKKIVFSHLVTSAFFWREQPGDNIMTDQGPHWFESSKKVRYLVGQSSRVEAQLLLPSDAAETLEKDISIERGMAIARAKAKSPLVGGVLDLVYRTSTSLARRFAPKN